MPAMFKPTIYTLECATGETAVRRITWSSWTSKSATGTGTLWIDLCKPNCAYGKIVPVGKAMFVLGKVRDSGSLGYEPLYTSTVVWTLYGSFQDHTS